MPVREGVPCGKGVSQEKPLRDDLTAELKNPKDSGEPQIIIEHPSPGTTHLYVIWSRWDDLEQVVRSRVILDAFTDARGEDEAIQVTVAMGLTQSEADRMGIE
jgi:hypothetical protein